MPRNRYADVKSSPVVNVRRFAAAEASGAGAAAGAGPWAGEGVVPVCAPAGVAINGVPRQGAIRTPRAPVHCGAREITAFLSKNVDADPSGPIDARARRPT